MANKIKPCTMNICRVCLTESSNMTSLLIKLGDSDRTIVEVLNFVSNINIRMCNKLPKQLCNDCKDNLFKADDFKRRCIESENILNDIFNSYKYELDKTLTLQNAVIKEEIPIETFDIVVQQPLHSNVTINEGESKNKLSLNQCPERRTVLKTVSVEFDKKVAIKQEFKKDIDSHDGDSNDFDDTFDSAEKHEVEDVKTENKNKILDKLVSNNKKVHKCLRCDIKFDSVVEWRLHRKVHSNNQNDELQYQCSMCNRKFSRKSSLSNHLRQHQVKDGVLFTCITCKREFRHQAHLDNHILAVHTCEQGITCTFCNNNFTTKESLELHLESHKTEKKYQCKICNKLFFMQSTLTDHIRTHTGEKPFLCSICGRGFSQNNNLQQHVRRHQGHKPFKCDDCERSFVTKGELQAHKRKHSGAHPFVCDDCGNGFTTSSSLVKHRRIHTGERPYSCEFCPMRFKASSTLTNHRRTHTGEKPYQCSHCEKAFAQRNDLISHIRCHTGERPYVCNTCGQAYRKASSLKAHLKVHNKEKEMNLWTLQDVAVS
ncbi:zinc finger protein OZF-like [Achroia grisella]|uniref:zinc finger protein OZF-like n=1 Tax=Achroia grisella TaxID=688607 RepID=UPI0027D25BA4|nr:zinc finger protein OZF-like [Achroia grisella]